MPKYVAAIDQGTTSSRLILFDKDGQIQQVDQREHEQITPKAGWVEHDPKEVWQRTRDVIGGAMASSDAEAGDVAAIGITNQRETTVVWDRETGDPVYNAIVWQDTRTEDIVARAGRGRGAGPPAQGRRPAALDLLLGAEDQVDPRQRRRGPQAGRGRRTRLRQHGHLGALEPHRRHQRRRPRDRRHQRLADDADEPGDARLARAEPRPDGDPEVDAAGDPLLQRDLRRGQGHGARRGPGGGHPRRPAGGDVRPDLLRPGRREEHLRHRLLPARQHRRGDRPHRQAADHGGGEARPRRAAGLHARGLDRGDRRGGAVAARPDRPDQGGAGNRKAGGNGRRQRRRLLRPRLLRPLRPLLARRRARRDPRPHRLRQQRPHRPRLPRGDRLAEQGGRRRRQRRRRRPLQRAESRRRDDRRRAADAVPGRRPRRPGDPPRGDRDDRPRRRLRRRPRGRLLVRHRRAPRALGRGQALGARRWTTTSATASTASGRRRSNAPSTGSSSRPAGVPAGSLGPWRSSRG